ncbi:helix-turn-helix domain-containing protein [Saccharopolyspora erythraea]|uniref:PucR family transcriptional regulator n=1 Tax=Saccharopolyspora erythraea TaxID=1836 RepID=UPI001BF0399A|nr:helix-turn-helix domain-containing protein [Saccharopolyspora erythraea]
MHSSGHSTGPLLHLVHACLDDLDELVDAFVAEIAVLRPYRDRLIPAAEVRADAEASFEMLLRLIAGLPVPHRIADVSERVGRRRAQAGMPLEVLLQAVRLDFRVLWSALLRRADPGDTQALIEGAVTVWEAVERHTVGVHVSYLDEAAVLARERERERSRLVAQLLATDGRDPQAVNQVATALEVDPNGLFAVAAGAQADQRALRGELDRLRANGVSAHLHFEERGPILLAALPRGVRAMPAHWMQDVPCGLGPVADGLAAVPLSVRVAVEVASAIGPGTTHPVGLREVWAEVAAARLAELGQALARSVLSEVDSVPPHERRRLLETAESFLASGSVADTAREVFCHRNTVLNRLRRLGELTGGDLGSPEHAALVLLALRVRSRAEAGNDRPCD